MFKVSRNSEYALIALQHLIRAPGDGLVSVAELASAQRIPRDILAKVLQGLKRAGVLTAAKGVGGGYRLARPAEQIHFLDVVRPFEEQIAVVCCQSSRGECDRDEDCTLREPMQVLNTFVMRQFEGLTMDLFANADSHLLSNAQRLGVAPSQPVVQPRRDPVPVLLPEPGAELD